MQNNVLLPNSSRRGGKMNIIFSRLEQRKFEAENRESCRAIPFVAVILNQAGLHWHVIPLILKYAYPIVEDSVCRGLQFCCDDDHSCIDFIVRRTRQLVEHDRRILCKVVEERRQRQFQQAQDRLIRFFLKMEKRNKRKKSQIFAGERNGKSENQISRQNEDYIQKLRETLPSPQAQLIGANCHSERERS